MAKGRGKKPGKRLPPALCLGVLVCIVAIRSFLLLPPDVSDHNGPEASPLDSPTLRGWDGQALNRSLVYIHVGKAGGETILWRFKLSCSLRKSKRKKARCAEQFQEGESFLSHATIGYHHCDKLKPTWSIPNATTFLVSLRDPVDRIVSWFQFMHPQNCLPERPSAACNLKKGANPWGLAFYRDCFPDVNDFIQSLNVPRVVASTNCTALAWETVLGNGPEGASNHMFYNYGYYANHTVVPYPDKEIFVVRQEMLWDDLRQVERLLGGDPRYPFETVGPTITHGSEKFLYRARLAPSLIPALCCAIQDEILAYGIFLERAVNLEPSQKAFTRSTLQKKCGFPPSPTDWFRQCNES